MKRSVALVLLCACITLCCAFLPDSVGANAEDVYVTAGDFSSLSKAVASANSSQNTVITVGGEIVLEGDLTVKGNVKLIGVNDAVLVFESGGKKTGISLSKNSNLSVCNLTVKRTVTAETEKFLFYTYANGATLSFEDVTFEVATEEIASISYDRVTYCSSKDALSVYCNNCTFNTDAYFYRGLMVFYNCDSMPQTAGDPTIKNFTDLKIDYLTGKLTFSADIYVSEDENFASLVKSGSKFKSETTYFAKRSDFSFSFKTKKLKRETPTEESVTVDYANETISFGQGFIVSRDSSFNEPIESGSKIFPCDTLYIKEKGEGIFEESQMFEMTLPSRSAEITPSCAFVCEFGFAMEHLRGSEYSLDGKTWTDSPVFIGLKSGEEYTVTVRRKATEKSFCSESRQIKVKVK